jgi:hypothetical protein
VGKDAHGEEVEAEVDAVAPLISGDETAEAAEPGVGALDLPVVPAEGFCSLMAGLEIKPFFDCLAANGVPAGSRFSPRSACAAA